MMKYLVINLDRSTDRWALFGTHNGSLAPFERFAAVEGATASRRDLIERGALSPEVSYTDGALGLALSHLALWSRAVEEGEAITVCEDDAILNSQFLSCQEQLLGQLPAEWEVILWGWNFDSVLLIDLLPGVTPCLMQFEQETMRRATAAFQQTRPAPRPYRLLRAFGTFCYSVSPGGAQKLRNACLPIRPLSLSVPGLPAPVGNFGIDVMMNAAYPRLTAYACFPPIAVSPNDHSTSLVQRPGHP